MNTIVVLLESNIEAFAVAAKIEGVKCVSKGAKVQKFAKNIDFCHFFLRVGKCPMPPPPPCRHCTGHLSEFYHSFCN